MRRALCALVPLLVAACASETERPSTPIKVEIVRTGNGYQLLRGGVPYTIRGAGMEVDDLAGFAAHGGNSIRNWTTEDHPWKIQALLDEAHAKGITVALCLAMKPERAKFDYDNPRAVARQFQRLRRDVIRYRDHPALLFWIVGNELNHSYTNPGVYDAVNDVARMVRELDPNHPTTTTISGFSKEVVAEVSARATALDFISFQLYGKLFSLPERLREANFDRPFMVTEWGTIGWWEMEKAPWGAPVELTSSEKADVLLRAHNEVLSTFDGQLIGSYVFFWGQKQERTPTWFGLLQEGGLGTESADVMQYLWTGGWPVNRAPRVESMRLDGRSAREGVTLVAGETYAASIAVVDPGGDPLRYRWEVKPESRSRKIGGDFERSIAAVDGWLADDEGPVVKITARSAGKYRLFAYAYDDNGNVAHANIPFLAERAGRR
jgi:hypothetical protein